MIATEQADEDAQVHEGGQGKPSIEDPERAVSKRSISSTFLRNTQAPTECVYASICVCLLQCERHRMQCDLFLL